MKSQSKKLLLVTSIALALTACNSSNKSTKPVIEEPPADTTPIAADKALKLDFTLPLADLGVDAGTLAGVTVNSERGEFAVLGENGALVYLSAEGAIAGESEIEPINSATFTGIEFIGDGNYLLSTSDSQVVLVNEQSKNIEQFGQVDFDINAVAYDETTGSAIVIDDGSPSKIVSISSSGDISDVTLDGDIRENSVTGLTLEEDQLLIASKSDTDNTSLIISSSMSGAIGTVWSIDSNTTSGLVLLDPGSPGFLTANTDPKQTVTKFETPPPPSSPGEEVLALHSSADIEFDQPSGIDFAPETSELFYVTDFGEVRKGVASGENQVLFEIDSQQGSFEAIVYHPENQTISLLMSDEAADDSFIVRFNMQGNELERRLISLEEPDHKFESLDYYPATDTYFVMTTSEGPKYLYEIEAEQQQVAVLPSQYDDFTIAGMALTDADRNILIVTEEWEDEEDNFNAGLLIKLQLTSMSELARYSIAVDKDGEFQGLTDPSDVAIDEVNNLIFITTDIDDSILYVFEGF